MRGPPFPSRLLPSDLVAAVIPRRILGDRRAEMALLNGAAVVPLGVAGPEPTRSTTTPSSSPSPSSTTRAQRTTAVVLATVLPLVSIVVLVLTVLAVARRRRRHPRRRRRRHGQEEAAGVSAGVRISGDVTEGGAGAEGGAREQGGGTGLGPEGELAGEREVQAAGVTGTRVLTRLWAALTDLSTGSETSLKAETREGAAGKEADAVLARPPPPAYFV